MRMSLHQEIPLLKMVLLSTNISVTHLTFIMGVSASLASPRINDLEHELLHFLDKRFTKEETPI